MSRDDLYDVIVVGGGPAGLTAGLYLARARYRVLILEKDDFGGQITITNEVVNYPGVGRTTGRALTQTMRQQAQDFGAEFLSAEAIGLDVHGDVKTVHTSRGDLKAFGILLATGASPRKLGFEGESEYAGRGVAYCATCDGFFFRNKPIVVVGGGDSAFEEADFLSRFGSSVTLIHRRSTFRASRIMVERAQRNPKIDFMLVAVVQEIRGDENGVQEVEVRNTSTEKTSVIPANGVFMAIGHTPATAFLNGLVDVDSAGYITVDGASTRTSEPGVFAAGDCVDSVYRQAISAAGMGCRAALDAQAYLDSLK